MPAPAAAPARKPMTAHFAFAVWVPVLTSIMVISDGFSETLLTPSARRNRNVSPVTDSIVPTCLSPPRTGDSIRARTPAAGGQLVAPGV
jgi:hypothetical protein